MIYYPNITKHAENARFKLECLIKEGRAFEINEEEFTRTRKQNSAIHVFCVIVSDELNRMGIEYALEDLVLKGVTVMYTPHIIKEVFWRPIQLALYGIRSTTGLLIDQITCIAEAIIKFFAERGVYMGFPIKEIMISAELEAANKLEESEARNKAND